jgi:glutamyl-tRNA synthetase
MTSEVRVRFAPSPTGYLHVGGARTALFNWLYARHCKGTFVLRIEDTDKARNSKEAVQVILDGLRWLGMDWDEGPSKGGEYGPYFQSERESIYQRYFDQLEAGGHLYLDNGAWRFRSLREVVVVDDMICGRIEFDLSNHETHPDMTIRRPDGSWIFHFVNVVDDIEMRISHVIRGEDHLSNTPKHLELFKALGKPAPRYAHIPLILNKDGSKMSKRDEGASITSYIDGGFVPEAVRNYLTLLGWSPKDGREKLEIEEVVQLFDLEKVNRKNAHFDIDKCVWLSGQYMSSLTLERFAELCSPFLVGTDAEGLEAAKLQPVLALVKEKVKTFAEVPAAVSYFFTEDYSFEPEASEKALKQPGASARLHALATAFEKVAEWLPESIEAALKATAAELGVKAGSLVLPTRVAVSGRGSGPSLYHMMEVLGRERSVRRIRQTAGSKAD